MFCFDASISGLARSLLHGKIVLVLDKNTVWNRAVPCHIATTSRYTGRKICLQCRSSHWLQLRWSIFDSMLSQSNNHIEYYILLSQIKHNSLPSSYHIFPTSGTHLINSKPFLLYTSFVSHRYTYRSDRSRMQGHS